MKNTVKSFFLVVFLTALIGCSTEDAQTEGEQVAQTIQATAAPTAEPENIPEPSPTPMIFKRYDIKALYKEVKALDEKYQAAVAQKHTDLLNQAEDEGDAILAKLKKVDGAYHPYHPAHDCEMAVIHAHASRGVLFSSATGDDTDETSQRIYKSNLADFNKAMSDCQKAADTNTSAAFREEKPEVEIRFID